MVLDKENAGARDGIFMIDASRGFMKDGNKNRLREQDVHKIVDTFASHRTVAKYARLVRWDEIERNDYNLNIPRYIDSSEPEDLQDIEAHLKGGIPSRDVDALRDFWHVMPSVRTALFGPGDRPGYVSPLVEAASVKATILEHPEFATFTARVQAAFNGWRSAHVDRLKDIKVGDKPKRIIMELAEDLLARFESVPLIDNYDVYQHLMNYWAEVMKDDIYELVEDGWQAARELRELVKNGDGKFTEEPDLIVGNGRKARRLKAELIPPGLVISRFFSADQKALEALDAVVEEASRQLEEMEEEHGGEDGLLAEARAE